MGCREWMDATLDQADGTTQVTVLAPGAPRKIVTSRCASWDPPKEGKHANSWPFAVDEKLVFVRPTESTPASSLKKVWESLPVKSESRRRLTSAEIVLSKLLDC